MRALLVGLLLAACGDDNNHCPPQPYSTSTCSPSQLCQYDGTWCECSGGWSCNPDECPKSICDNGSLSGVCDLEGLTCGCGEFLGCVCSKGEWSCRNAFPFRDMAVPAERD